MSRPRIVRDRVYVVRVAQGISGARLPDAEGVTLGACIGSGQRFSRYDVLRDASLSDSGTYRLDDGHLPDFQPRAAFGDAIRWLVAGGTVAIRESASPRTEGSPR